VPGAQRLVDGNCVEQGYLRLPESFRCQLQGDYEAGAAVAADGAAIAQRFGDRDLFAIAAHAQGTMLVRGGRLLDGLALLDEAMVAVTTGEVSPIASGIVYCGVILACRPAYEPGGAREWTASLTRWCESQPDMVAFSGGCHVHRAEVRRLEGAWSDALEEHAVPSIAPRAAAGPRRDHARDRRPWRGDRAICGPRHSGCAGGRRSWRAPRRRGDRRRASRPPAPAPSARRRCPLSRPLAAHEQGVAVGRSVRSVVAPRGKAAPRASRRVERRAPARSDRSRPDWVVGRGSVHRDHDPTPRAATRHRGGTAERHVVIPGL
jgi:hypothetical protein